MGITLTNYWATTHPSEPNYCAAAGGDNFGMDNDDFHSIPEDISTVVDLLDTKGISWAEYQEDIPYPGFQGFNFSNQKTFANDYVRKHDPLILYQSVTKNATRLSLIKGFTSLESDVVNQRLPQWAFITPNMTNDGHDVSSAPYMLAFPSLPWLPERLGQSMETVRGTAADSPHPDQCYFCLCMGTQPDRSRPERSLRLQQHFGSPHF